MNLDSLPLFAQTAPPKVDAVTVESEPQDECLSGLRPYQIESIEQLRQGIRDGKKNQVLCSPTGSGKSVMAIHLLQECQRKGNRAIFIAERITLIDQFSGMLDAAGLPHGVHQGDHWRREPHQLIQVASAQTLQRRGFPPTSIILIDECHVSHKHTLERIAKRDCITIGLTATPFAAGMGKYYDGIVNVTTTNKLTDEGFLVPPKIYAPKEPDMRGVKVVAGEWVEDETSKRATKIVGDVVQEYLKHGAEGKFIAFGCDVNHCRALQAQFMSAGIQCALHVYTTPDAERAANMTEFRKPDSCIRGLISVSALSRGLDVPDVSVIIMCRPLKSSFAEFIQVMGRGLRPYDDKTHCIVLDLAGNTVRFFDRMNELFENGCHELDDGKKKEKKKAEKKEETFAKCPQCAHVHKRMPVCPSCGFQYPKRNTVAHEAGELKEITRTPVASGYDKQEFHAMLVSLWNEHNMRSPEKPWKPGWISNQYRERFGVWPRGIDTSMSLPPSQKIRNWLRSRWIAYQKAKEKASA